MAEWDDTKLVRKGNYLKGSFVRFPSEGCYLKSVNPGNLEDVIGKFPFAESAVNMAVAIAREAQPQWHRVGIQARAQCLSRYREQLALNLDLLASLVTRETGKPRWEAHAEILATIKRIDVMLTQGISLLDGWWIPELEGGCEYHPRGVVVVLSTFSMPVQYPNNHIVAALLAGNAVIYKPSKYTPGVGQLLAEMLDRARFPAGVIAMLQGNGRTVGSRLVRHPDVDSIHLDGSLEVANEIRTMTQHEPWKRLVFNACGRASAIVLDDAELDRAVHEVACGAFLTTGQRRSSTARALVARPLAKRFLRRMRQVVDGLVIGNGLQDGVFLGPLISEARRKWFLLYQEGLAGEGHSVISEARKLNLATPGYYVSPSVVLIDPRLKRESLGSEFVAGPGLEVQEVEDFEEAVEVHNQSRAGLVSSIFTQNRELMKEARYRLRTGVINYNRSTVILSARLPFDGRGYSSSGFPMGLLALRTCSFPMSFLEDTRPFDISSPMPGLRWPGPEILPSENSNEGVQPDDSPTAVSRGFEAVTASSSSDSPPKEDDEVTPVAPPLPPSPT